MLSKSQKTLLTALIIPLLAVIAFLQMKIDPERHQFEPDQGIQAHAVSGLPIEFALGAFTGFREAVAGLLWARTDEFFHTGNYEAVMPMVRIITWLDPHFVTVYETGAWHMDYNFTDYHEQSDRRYIPLSIALMNEGIKNNPNEPELYSDLGLTHYFRKIGDFEKARESFEAGQRKIEEIFAAAAKDPHNGNLHELQKNAATAVVSVGHGLAHSYEALGMIQEAADEWKYCIMAHQRNLDLGFGKDTGEAANLKTSQRQLYDIIARSKWRVGLDQHPVDMAFHPVLTRIGPAEFTFGGKLHVVGSHGFVLETGKTEWGPQDGCRINIRINDEGYKMPVINSFTLSNLNLDPNTTIYQDSASTRDGKIIDRKIDMSKDPQIYSLRAKTYDVTFWFNPSNPNDCPINVQDRIGWLGEGMTDSKYLDTSGEVPGDMVNRIPNLRLLKKTFNLSRDDIMGNGVKVWQ
jgi:tetratricopeptide (TPR) repeat protein